MTSIQEYFSKYFEITYNIDSKNLILFTNKLDLKTIGTIVNVFYKDMFAFFPEAEVSHILLSNDSIKIEFSNIKYVPPQEELQNEISNHLGLDPNFILKPTTNWIYDNKIQKEEYTFETNADSINNLNSMFKSVHSSQEPNKICNLCVQFDGTTYKISFIK